MSIANLADRSGTVTQNVPDARPRGGAAPPPPAEPPLVPLRDAERLVDALNRALESGLTVRDRSRSLLASYQQLLGHGYDVHLVLHEDLGRAAGPRVIERVTLGPTLDRLEPRDDAQVQRVIDEAAPAVRMIIPDVLSHLRLPRVFVVGQDVPAASRAWFADWAERHLAPQGWTDLLIGCWATGPDRMVAITAYGRRDLPEFGEEQRQMASLMLRAAAPVLHGRMFDGEDRGADAVAPADEDGERVSPLAGHDLSARQRDVLRLLLQGHSEKQVAADLGVSTHTVHTHVKRLYSEFDVSSRGELLALFVDRRLLAEAGREG